MRCTNGPMHHDSRVSFPFTWIIRSLQEARAAFDAEALRTGKAALLLAAGVPVGKSTIDSGYEVSKISP